MTLISSARPVGREPAPRNLDIDELRTFLAVVETMSFSRAGDIIGLTQSAVSLRLRRIEQALGVSLLVRRQGRVTELTPAGVTIYGYARKIIGLNDAAVREVQAKPPQGSVRIGIPADFFDGGFLDALSAVQADIGAVEAQIDTDVSDRLLARCRADDIDIAFYKRIEADGDGRPIRPLPLQWKGLAPEEGVAGGEGPLPLVCFPEGCAYRRLMLEALGRAGIAHRVVLTTPSIESLRKAVASGVGVTALPAGEAGLPTPSGLPPLRSVCVAMVTAPQASRLVCRIADRMAEALSEG